MNVSVISDRAELLLTSSGVTTNSAKERLFEMGRLTGARKINVLRLSDGWQSFQADEIGLIDKLSLKAENMAAQLFSKKYLKWALGNRAIIHTESLEDKQSEDVDKLLGNTDILVVPGGNTYRTMQSLVGAADVVRQAVSNGLPYVGESAGSIIAGQTLTPASLEPADYCPSGFLLNIQGLDLIHADIVVHTKGEIAFDMHGPLSTLSKLVLRATASDPTLYQPVKPETDILILNNSQALSVNNGEIQPI